MRFQGRRWGSPAVGVFIGLGLLCLTVAVCWPWSLGAIKRLEGCERMKDDSGAGVAEFSIKVHSLRERYPQFVAWYESEGKSMVTNFTPGQ